MLAAIEPLVEKHADELKTHGFGTLCCIVEMLKRLEGYPVRAAMCLHKLDEVAKETLKEYWAPIICIHDMEEDSSDDEKEEPAEETPKFNV